MEAGHFVLRGISEEALSGKSTGQSTLFESNSPGKPLVLLVCYVAVLTLRRMCDRHRRQPF